MIFKLISHLAPFTPHPYKGTAIDCPVCGAETHSRISVWDRSLKRLPTELCGQCGLFYTNPMPTDEELSAYYAAVYRAAYQFSFLGPRKTHRRKKAAEARRRADAIEIIRPAAKGGRTLDFGCGSGELVRELAARGFNAHGFEPGAQYGAHAKDSASEGRIFIGPWREMIFEGCSFDFISCLHVLEHLNDPLAALSRLRQWLAPGGVLYLETPNMQAPAVKGFDCFHFAHVLGFSRANLLFAAERAGFALFKSAEPTSLFLVRNDDPRGAASNYDLAETARTNRHDYSQSITPFAYFQRHLQRLRKTVGEELKRS